MGRPGPAGAAGSSAGSISGRYCPPVTNPPPSQEPEPEEPEPKKPKPKYSRLHLLNQPIGHAATGGTWPHRNLISTRPAAPHLLRAIAIRLLHDKNERGLSLKRIEAMTGVNVASLSRLLRGETWATVPIIAHLERGLDIDLWGDEHRKHRLP